MRRIAVFTGTRADWGLLSPVARELRSRGADVVVAATNLHLSPRHGDTLGEVEADGFTPRVIAMDVDDDSPLGRCRAMADCLQGCAELLADTTPDMAVILGDRYEMLSAATACLMTRVPIAHIAGGAVSYGAVDDSIRHAITKMASLHLTETETYRRRILAMGEDPALAITVGAIGVENLLGLEPVGDDELRAFTGIDVDGDTLLVTYHPATLDSVSSLERVRALGDALDRFPQTKVLVTAPNNDAGASAIFDFWKTYRDGRPGRVALVPSLGRRRYLTAMRRVAAVVGNSSSGIVEVPSAGIPSVDIGSRQRGRLAADSVIHCSDSADEIADAIALALDPATRRKARLTVNPYEGRDTVARIADAILETPLEALRAKTFHDNDATP